MFNKRRSIIIVKLLISLLSLILIVILIGRTLSKYETTSTAQANIQAAFYLLNDNYQSMNIKLGMLEPRAEEYSYTFSVSNNDNAKRTETSLEYDLKIITTTNLPLTYELYKIKEGESTTEKVNAITNEEISPDEYGTYFRTISTNTETFGHQKNETNIYTLVVHFSEEYRQIQYQDIIESIEIKIDSRQLIEEQTA